MKVSRAFKSSTTIVDVGKKINDFSMKDVMMAQERIENWNIDRPGIDVLEWAFGYLAENNFIDWFRKTTQEKSDYADNTKKSFITFLFVITTFAYFYPVIKHANNKLDCETTAKNYIIKKLIIGSL